MMAFICTITLLEGKNSHVAQGDDSFLLAEPRFYDYSVDLQQHFSETFYHSSPFVSEEWENDATQSEMFYLTSHIESAFKGNILLPEELLFPLRSHAFRKGSALPETKLKVRNVVFL